MKNSNLNIIIKTFSLSQKIQQHALHKLQNNSKLPTALILLSDLFIIIVFVSNCVSNETLFQKISLIIKHKNLTK